MHAFILAGGVGARLKPYTTLLPKPLVPIGNQPILEILIKQLSHHGFNNITISVGYLSHLIQTYFSDGRNWNVNINYCTEKEPLGTAGPLSLIAPQKEPILVINGDTFTTLNFRKLYEEHVRSGAVATVAKTTYNHEIRFGVLKLEGNNVKGFDEKPKFEVPINTGIYVLSPEAIEMIERNRKMDMSELIQKLISAGKVVKSFDIGKEYYLDIGIPEHLEKANEDIDKMLDHLW